MDDKSSNNKRIAKNTILLYFRMIFIMVINLYTSRVILDVLGAEDYGTYNVVGGIVTMLSFITASISGAVSRFINFEIGKSDGDVKRLFRCASTIFYLLAIIAFILAETVGLWFLQTKLNIPEGRETAALWVYQFSVLSFIISILSVTYNALIIAREKMNAFAYISIYDGLARLAILYIVAVSGVDHLIVYAALLASVQMSVRLIYTVYCKRCFEEASSKWLWNTSISRPIFSYAGWIVLSQIAIISYTQGINILLNIYFGPIVNASRAIAFQVQTALAQFYANFNTAIRPQIISNYAKGDLDYMRTLVLRSGRISFMLAILVSIPFMTFTEYILELWLANPPEHVVTFVRLTLIAGISNSLSQHTIIAIHATGEIKKFQIIEGLCLLTILPISWLLLKYAHVDSEVVIFIYVLVEVITQFIRVCLVYPKIGIQISSFLKDILRPSLLSLVLFIIPSFLLYKYCFPTSFLELVLEATILVMVGMVIIICVGLDKPERTFILNKIDHIKSMIVFK